MKSSLPAASMHGRAIVLMHSSTTIVRCGNPENPQAAKRSAGGAPTAPAAMQCTAARAPAALPSAPAAGAARARRLQVRCQAAQAETATQRLTKDDLVAYLASGCKPREDWR